MRKTITMTKILASAALLSAISLVQADVLVVVHPSYGASSVSTNDVSKVFLGKSSALPGGGPLIPIDQNEAAATRGDFYKKVANKDAAQLNAYWSKLIFTGQGQPPKAVGGDDVVIELVSKNPNMIGYVSGSAATGKVKVVAKVP